MKRIVIGGLAILSAATLPITGFASAASVVDYEYSVGQIDGADTINWVVEATDDGGYVVGGQTVMCYREPIQSMGPMMSVQGGTVSDAAAEGRERVSYKDCVKFYQENPDSVFFEKYEQSGRKGGGMKSSASNSSSTNNASGDGFASSMSNSLLGKACLGASDVGAPSGGAPVVLNLKDGDDNEGDETQYQYLVYCADYIAKFKTNGAKEWLTTFEDSYTPVAVNKINNSGYRLLDRVGGVYNFSNNGEKSNEAYIETSNISKAYINNDGSFLVGSGFGDIKYYNADTTPSEKGLLGEEGDQSRVQYDDFFPTNDGYVVVKAIHNQNGTLSRSVIDASKDLSTTKERKLKGVENPYMITANRNGDVMVGNTDENNKSALISFDKNGNKLGEYTGAIVEEFKQAAGDVMTYKDFTIGIADSRNGVVTPDTQQGFVSPVMKLVKFNSDMTIQYEYTGSGSEFIADVAELKDKSLTGVGLAVKGSTTIPVTGDANGGYLRLVANTTTKPASTTEKVKNPKTFDGIGVLAIAGGALLLGFGAFLRKHLMRRSNN